ncbi:MAG: alpha/beta hydrolase [Planctomycetota bacterium]|nr:alpha/beta hydrolase [Planctomycetota bacterium]
MDDPEKAQKIVFFSGLGADEKIFWLQANRFPQLETPRWAIPLPGEKMEEYIDRWIEELNLTPGQIVGGASFGGLIAQRVARKLNAPVCILFGSVKSGKEFPRRIRIWRPIHRLAFVWLIRFWQGVVAFFARWSGFLLSRRLQLLLRQFSQSDAYLVQWSIRQVFESFAGRPGRFADRNTVIVQIHGSRDPVFPINRIEKAAGNSVVYPISNGGHVPTMSHADEVNNILQKVLDNPRQISQSGQIGSID